MNIFRHVKGLAVALLAIALVVTAFATTKVSAEDAAPKAIKATFTFGDYKYTVEDISKTTKVKVSDVLANLVKGEDTFLNANGEYYISAITLGGDDVDLTKEIEFDKDAAADIAYTVTAGKIAIVYNPDKDTIDVTAGNGVQIYIGTAKTSDAQISKKATKNNLDPVTGGSISISLSDKDKGVKLAEDKDAFFYIGTVEPTKTAPQAVNFSLKGTEIKKLDVAFNYALAYEGNDVKAGVITLKDVTDKTTPKDIANTDAIFMSTETKSKASSEWASVDTLTGGDFYAFVKLLNDQDKTKYKLTFKVKGTATCEGYNGQRGSKVKAIAVAKEAKAPKVKVDYAKGTVSVKNGFDYVVVATTGAITATGSSIVAQAKTILPYNKSDSAAVKAIINTTTFEPVAKFADTDETAKANYTKEKIKALDILNNAEFKAIWETGSAYIVVRKSATAKKPASKFSDAIEITAPATGPAVSIKDGVLASTKVDGDKKVALTPTLTADCEYCIVKSGDLATLDLSTLKWKKLAKGKGKISSADKANYKVGDTKIDTVVTDASVVVLVRTAGVKAKGTTPGTLPSEYIVTTVSVVGDSYVWKVQP